MKMTGNKWVDDLLKANSTDRKKLRETLLDGIKYFNSRWKKGNNGSSKLVSTDPKAKELNKLLKSSEVEFVGFSPTIMYIKESGAKAALESLWNHNNGTPVLLYKHKKLPMMILAGPTVRLDSSMLEEIDANSNIVVPLKGITS